MNSPVLARFRRATLAFALSMATVGLASCGGGGTSEVVQPTAPSSPTDVRVTLLSLSSVRVDWTANPAAQQVRSYNVFRNGTKIGETTSPTFTDTGLSELQTYRYTISANGSGTLVSPASEATGPASFTIPDLTAPRVTGVVPASAATGVLTTAPVTITFSEALTASTVSTATITLKNSANSTVAGVVAYVSGATIATFTPSAALSPNTSYTLSVSTDVKDLSGNQLAAAFTTQFITALPVDNTPPTVVSTAPASSASDVPVTGAVTVTFSEPLGATSISTSNFLLAKAGSGAPVAITVGYAAGSRVVTLTPIAALENSTSYVVTVTTAVKDTAGNALVASYVSGFSTVGVVDNNPPTVFTVSPQNGALNVAVATPVTVTFSEPMTASTITSSTVKLVTVASGVAVPATLTFDAPTNRATLRPAAALVAGASYSVVVTTGVKDLAGNALSAQFSSTFTTVPPDTTPPTVITTTPVNGAGGVSVFVSPSFVFSEPLNASTVTSTNFSLKETATGTVVQGTVQYLTESNTLAFAVSGVLNYGTSYTATIGVGVRDVAGNALASANTVTFTTAAQPAVVTAVSPATRAVNVPASATVQVTFSVPIKSVSLSSSTFVLKNRSTGLAVPGSISYDGSTRVATLTPSAPLANNASYSVSVTGGVTDSNDVPIASGIESCFTPGPGTGAATTMTGFWSGDSACGEIHWHITMVQSGNTLSLASNCPAGDCQLSAINAEGLRQLNGASFTTVVTLTGTVTGNDINFTVTTSNGMTLTFVGAFATAPAGSTTTWIIGTMGGGSVPPTGMGFERQRP